jgi:hypothetical protein
MKILLGTFLDHNNIGSHLSGRKVVAIFTPIVGSTRYSAHYFYKRPNDEYPETCSYFHDQSEQSFLDHNMPIEVIFDEKDLLKPTNESKLPTIKEMFGENMSELIVKFK